jgi:hypothetical protein
MIDGKKIVYRKYRDTVPLRDLRKKAKCRLKGTVPPDIVFILEV